MKMEEEREWIHKLTDYTEEEKMVKDCIDTNNTERYERHVGSVCPECGSPAIIIRERGDITKSVEVCTFCGYTW